MPTTAPAPAAAGAAVAQQSGAPANAAASATPSAELANDYVQRADSLYQAGKLEPALAEYRRGISHDPTDSDTWYGLAETLHEVGRDKQALETYALALTMIVHAPELRGPYAQLLLANKKRDEAIKVLQKGIELDPDNSDELKTLLGTAAVASLDIADAPADSAAPATAAVAAAPKAAAAKSGTAPAKKAAPVKRKKLCKLFCNVAKPK